MRGKENSKSEGVMRPTTIVLLLWPAHKDIVRNITDGKFFLCSNENETQSGIL